MREFDCRGCVFLEVDRVRVYDMQESVCEIPAPFVQCESQHGKQSKWCTSILVS